MEDCDGCSGAVSEELGSGCPIMGRAIRLCLVLIWWWFQCASYDGHMSPSDVRLPPKGASQETGILRAWGARGSEKSRPQMQTLTPEGQAQEPVGMARVVTEPTLSESCSVSMGIQQGQLSRSQEPGLWTFLILPCKQLSSRLGQSATRLKLVSSL